MINPQHIYNAFCTHGVDFYTGVPDSLLKNFCAFITQHNAHNHIISANEGGAIGIAMGYHLATAKIPLVYMQNSGLGNIVNPVLSMTDKDIYAIPIVLLIGWRGEMLPDGTQLKDEPQHKTQGKLTLDILDSMEIPYTIIDQHTPDINTVVANTVQIAKTQSSPVALVVRKGTFATYNAPHTANPYTMTREQAIAHFVDSLTPNAIVVSTTGMPSRELFEIRMQKQHPHNDFLCIGGMGHASQIAVGVAHATTGKTVYCLDGDGAMLMHMGAMPINAKYPIIHVVLNNGVHDSVGGQPTVGFDIDMCGIAQSCGYKTVQSVDNKDDLQQALQHITQSEKPIFLEIKVAKGNRSDLGRPTQSPITTKQNFQQHVKNPKKNI